MDHIDSSKIIDELGGTGEVARLCDISSQAVSKWRRVGIPIAWLAYFKLLRPDLFPAPAAPPAVASAPAAVVVRHAERDGQRRTAERRDGDRRGCVERRRDDRRSPVRSSG